jgi:hypothetical protein
MQGTSVCFEKKKKLIFRTTTVISVYCCAPLRAGICSLLSAPLTDEEFGRYNKMEISSSELGTGGYEYWSHQYPYTKISKTSTLCTIK